ncbi:MAG: 4Fe-4S dicluster domain-containing protein [Bacteroidales bacterium]|nr:4Fe-4S dicluster domain-containing protein [Bacteroidales bacterium]
MHLTGCIYTGTHKALKAVFLLLLLFVMMPPASFAQQRFPRPEFETGYEQPTPVTPEPRSLALEYVDVAMLLAVMALVTWFLLKKRSRTGIFWISVFTLVYFGFYRNGCICSVGSVQNVALSLFNTGYSVSLTVLAFFLLPLIFSLFYGRVFCAGACALGAIQDLIIVKPITFPSWLQKTLGIFPFVYLGLAILFAVTGTDFIICRYDPFVGIFRMGAEFTMIVLGIGMLLIGMFVARPYCRFVCPYGALLRVTSFFARRHMTITPAECIQCRLCESSCPFDAIDFPGDSNARPDTEKNLRRFILYLVLIPVWVALGGFAVSSAHVFLSRAHPDVFLANLLITKPEMRNDLDNIDIQTFLSSGKPLETLVEEAEVIQNQFYTGGWILGGFIGFVIGITLLNQVVFRRKTDYEPHKGNCYSCGRCMKYCPVIKKQ